jgi:hypothetical protein
MRIKELQKIKKGQWIFTCKLEPLRFKRFFTYKDDYVKKHWESPSRWIKHKYFNDFETMEGTTHSALHCGLELITKNYAYFFRKNKCWELFPKEDLTMDEKWEIYENRVKDLCKLKNIKFEGV